MTGTPITLYSIGHSNVPTARLIALLEQHAIATLCDVRSKPYSRYNPQFNREALADSMLSAGIAYRYFGDTLGGMPDAAELRSADGALADYDRIAQSAGFRRGLEELIALGTRAPTAFMCGEADYHTCHRHKLITPALLERGVAVLHIMADGSLEPGAIEPQQMRMF